MPLPRVRLIWGGARQAPGHWRLGLWGVSRREIGQPARVAVSMRGMLLWLLGLSLAGYLAGTTALFFWFNRSPYNLVRWTDTLLLPVKWRHVRELLGRAMIAEGLDDLKARRWSEASMKLRVGLARSPHDLRARLALADFFMLANRPSTAIEVLSADLAAGYPGKRYLTRLFGIAAQGEDYDAIISACDQFLPTEKTDRAWLLTQKTSALVGADRAAEALELLEAEGDAVSPMLRESRVLALLASDRSAEAIDYLDHWPETSPAIRAQILRLRARACREAGRFAEMDAALESLRELEPANPRALAYKIVQSHLAGRSAETNEALDDYIRRFAGSPQNLMLVASALVEAHAPALVQRVAEEAAMHGFRAAPFKLLLLQAQIDAADWRSATATLAEIRPAMKNASQIEQYALTWAERLVAVASQANGGPEAVLFALFQERPLPMRVYRQTCEALVKAGRFETARSILQLGERVYPESRTLDTVRQKVERSIAAQAPAKPAVTKEPNPEPEVESAFFAKLAAHEEAERWTEAAQALRTVRVQKPAWLSRREADVLEAQIRVSLRTGETLEMLGAAKLYLDGQRDRATHTLELARRFADEGHKREGELLVQEVLRKHPQFPPALRLQKEWAAAK